MDNYKIRKIGDLLQGNTYPGRGIIIGKTQDGKNACAAYFIMGRSANSRNRVFEMKDDVLFTKPFDESKVEDPSLIIYPAVRSFENKLIVTNGDQTDTIYDGLKGGLTFDKALESREFEPDAPNFTPRISGMLEFSENDFSYKMSILKSIDEIGSACARYVFSYPAVSGLGHFIHTYNCDGNPIPTFSGEPERIVIDNSIDDFSKNVWNALDSDNKISLFVRFINLETGKNTDRIINKNS